MIIPSASNQMGPGGYGLGSPVIPIAQKGMVVGAQVGLTVISLVGVGKFLKAARVISAADAALVRLYQTGRIPWLGASTYYPPGWIGPASTIGVGTLSTWFTPGSSSGGGGPGEIPNLHRPPPSIEETGEILSNPPMAGGKAQNGHGIDPQFGEWGSPMHAAEWIRDDDGYHWICPTTHRLKKIHGKWMCVKKG